MLPAWKNPYPLAMQLNLNHAIKKNWSVKRKVSYIFKTNFATTESLKGIQNLENLSLCPKTIYHIYWFMPVAIYHNQNKVGRKSFLKQFITFTNLCT